MSDHDGDLSRAFDGQAPLFERAPIQSDPAALSHLVDVANFAPGSRILDAGCGPGLVSRKLLDVGCRVFGVDLSREMIERARKRCLDSGDRAEFRQGSVFDPELEPLAPFDGSLSRYVLHHVLDPLAFIRRQFALLRPGSVLVVSDHVTDPDPAHARRHEQWERARDKTHTRNLTGGELVDLLARAGLSDIRYIEESFTLDFDEWFDRGTPAQPKEWLRAELRAGPGVRGFSPTKKDDNRIEIRCVRAIVRGVKP